MAVSAADQFAAGIGDVAVALQAEALAERHGNGARAAEDLAAARIGIQSAAEERNFAVYR